MKQVDDWQFVVIQPGKKCLRHFKTYEGALKCQKNMVAFFGAADTRIYERALELVEEEPTERRGLPFSDVATNGVTMIQFEWDEAKNRANIRKHGFDFADAEQLFSGILLVRADLRRDYGESRWVGIGTIRGRTAVVAFTQRGPETMRIISLRKATRHEREEYEKAVQDELEAG